MNRLCVIHGKLRDVFVNTLVDDHPGLSPVFLHRFDRDINSVTVNMFVTMTSSTEPILVLPRINPFGWDLSSLRGYENS